jgi:hypothetical protein
LDDDAQIAYLESQIIKDRNNVEESDTLRKFNKSKEVSKDWIKTFLPQIV